MIARWHSLAISGIEALSVVVEVDIGPGLPGTRFVGLPNTALRESRDRIRSAIRNCGFRYPDRRVLVNLAPADLRKEGPSFDLAIALGVLLASRQLRGPDPSRFVVLGELGLEGDVRPVRGALVAARALALTGTDRVLVVPEENVADVESVAGLHFLPVPRLNSAVAALGDSPGTVRIRVGAPRPEESGALPCDPDPGAYPTCPVVAGQAMGKRAVDIAVAGGHHLFLVGPPGSGKTLLARRLAALHPPLDERASLEVRMIHGLRSARPLALPRRPPMRAPHHTVSPAALIGGGNPVLPGEITLAHRGVLFLDELGEFPARLLETLRQPVEERSVRISRSGQTVDFPAAFLLVAAMNPCPCGHHGAGRRRCACTEGQIRRYRSRVSGPLLDRFDMQLEVPPVGAGELAGGRVDLREADARAVSASRRAIRDARSRQAERYAGQAWSLNGYVEGGLLDRFLPMEPGAARWLARGATTLGLSGRSIHRVRRVARTIADLGGSDAIGSEHVREALQFRFRPNEGLC